MKIKNLNFYVTMVILAYSVVLYYVISIPIDNLINFKAFNGNYQSYNAASRVLNGEIPGRDFQPYLGIGTVYLQSVSTILGGGNYIGSVIGIDFLHKIIFLFICSVILLLDLNWKRSVIISIILCASLTSLYKHHENILGVYNPWFVVIRPINSDYAFRMVISFILAAASLIIWQKYYLRRSNIYTIAGAVLFLASLAPFWSNDGGVSASLSSIILIYGLLYSAAIGFNKTICFIIFYLICLVAGVIIFGNIITLGNLMDWFSYNFLGVRDDQTWYFPQSNITFFGILRQNKYVNALCIFAIIFIIFRSHSFYRERKHNDLFYMYILTSNLIAASIPYVWYSPDPRYFAFVAMIVVVSAIGQFIKLIYYRNLNLILFFIAIILNGYLTARVFIPSNVEISHRKQGTDLFPVPELGGNVSWYFRSAVELARQIRAETKDLPPTSRMISTYRSMMDHIVGAENPSGFDYLIHVLGDSARENYLTRFREARPLYVTTLRDNYSLFGWWAWRRDWWFFSYLLENYDARFATSYNIVWRRKSHTLNANATSHSCAIEKSDGRYFITVPSAAEIPEDLSSPFGTLIAVELKYDARWEGIRAPKIYLYDVQTPRIAPDQPRDDQIFLDPKKRSIEFPSEYDGNEVHFELGWSQFIDAKVELSSCTWHAVTPIQNTGILEEVSLDSTPRVGWDRGIAMSGDIYPVIRLQDDEVWQRHYIFAGQPVRLANGEIRRVKETRGRWIFLTGGPLDPEQVGYPHKVIFLFR